MVNCTKAQHCLDPRPATVLKVAKGYNTVLLATPEVAGKILVRISTQDAFVTTLVHYILLCIILHWGREYWQPRLPTPLTAEWLALQLFTVLKAPTQPSKSTCSSSEAANKLWAWLLVMVLLLVKFLNIREALRRARFLHALMGACKHGYWRNASVRSTSTASSLSKSI